MFEKPIKPIKPTHTAPGFKGAVEHIAALDIYADLGWTRAAVLEDLLKNVTALARVKFGNLDPDANKLFEQIDCSLSKY